MPSLPTGGVGTRQMDRSIRSPLQPPSAARVAAAAPRSDPAHAPHRPPPREWLDPNQDARSVISNRHQARRDDDAHRAKARTGDAGPGRTIEGLTVGERRPLPTPSLLSNRKPSLRSPAHLRTASPTRRLGPTPLPAPTGSTRFYLQPTSGRPSDRKAWPNPCSLLFSDWN